MEKSPTLQAIDLPRTYLGNLQLSELEDHAKEVINTLEALAYLGRQPGFMSSISYLNLGHLERKLRAHLAQISIERENLQSTHDDGGGDSNLSFDRNASPARHISPQKNSK